MNTESTNQDPPNGPVTAAMVAGGLGCATIGLMTVLAAASKNISNALNWWNPAGPLTGKALTGVGVFFAAWVVLHLVLGRRNVNFARAAGISIALLVLGLLGTFPPLYDLFAPK